MRSEICRYVANRPIPISPRHLATSHLSGEWSSPYTGKGMDFKSHRAFELGDDLRSINMSMSIRSGKRMVVERIAMRDISVYLMLDCTASMGVRRKAEILKAIALMLIYGGATLEMRVGAAILTDSGYCHLGIGMGSRHVLRLMENVEHTCDNLNRTRVPPDSGFKVYGLQRQLPAGCILLYISDYLDRDGFPSVGFPFILNTRKLDLIPVVVQDDFEYSFPEVPGETLLELADPETDEVNPIWFGRSETRMLRQIHEKRFSEIHDGFTDRGLNYLHIANPEIESIHHQLSHFFLYR